MKKYYLSIMLIVAVALAFQQNLVAQKIDPQHPLYPFFYGDTRSEIEKISSDPAKMRDYIASQEDINARYKYGRTLLHYAAIKNYKDIAKVLLDRGADINALDETKNTPLHDAVSYKAMDVIGFLLERGADMNLKNDRAETALHNVIYWLHKKSAIQCVQLFMEKGFDVKKSADAKLLYETIAMEHKEIALLFLKKGVAFNDDALRASVNKGYSDVFNILVQRGANPNQSRIFHDACESGNMKIITTIAEKGGRPSLEDVEYCLYNGHKEAAVYLNKTLRARQQPEADIRRRCSLEPVDGTCKALFTNAYFDKQTNTCLEFIYGGCGGVVPFADLAACKRICEEQ